MKKLLLFFVFLMISGVFAQCNSNQIDINIASKTELENLYGIGPVKSEEIIKSRPFDSIEDLIKVKGIGEITLNKIKEQGLACVNSSSQNNQENQESSSSSSQTDQTTTTTQTTQSVQTTQTIEMTQNIAENQEELETNKKIYDYSQSDFVPLEEKQKTEVKTPKLETIVLSPNTQNIKTSNEKEKQSKGSYAVYGFIAFCILLTVLFILKQKKYKNGLN